MIAFLGCRRTMNNMVSVGSGEWEVGGTYLMPDEGKRNTKRTKLIVVYRKTEHRGIRNRGKTINFMLMARHRRLRICNIEQLRKNSIKGTKKVNEMEISFLHNFGCHLPASPSSFKLFFPSSLFEINISILDENAALLVMCRYRPAHIKKSKRETRNGRYENEKCLSYAKVSFSLIGVRHTIMTIKCVFIFLVR